jgi:DNA-binding GntR family transcriptional regulator
VSSRKSAAGRPREGVNEWPQSRSASGTLVDELAAQIQTGILIGEHEIGSWLRQDALARRYGVSRTPVREALRKLQAADLVELRPHAGALVRGPTSREVRESYLVRAELEGVAAELAAPWISQRQLDELRRTEGMFEEAIQLAGRTEGATSDDQAMNNWAEANDIFHEVIQEASGNGRLQAVIKDLHRSFPRRLTWTVLSEDPRLLNENVLEHQAVREALDRRAGPEARRLMVAHVLRAGELIARWFERQQK